MENVDYKRIFFDIYPQLCLFGYGYLDNLELSREIARSIFEETIKSEIKFGNENQMKVYLYGKMKNKCLAHLEKLGFQISEQYDLLEKEGYDTDDFILVDAEIDTDSAIRNILKLLSKEVGKLVGLSIGNFNKN